MEVPRYFGSIDDIIDAVLLPNPCSEQEERVLASKPFYANSSESHPAAKVNSDPTPWFGTSVESAVSLIVSELSLRQIGQHLPDGPIKKELIARVDASIADFLDDYCGNAGPATLFPWPGPPPWVLPTVNQLSIVASNMQDRELSDSVLNVAATMAQKSFVFAART